MTIVNIDQRPDKEVMFRCDCGGDHFLVFSATHWPAMGLDPAEDSWYVAVLDEYRATAGWGRIRGAWNILIGRDQNRHHSVHLNATDVQRVREWCDELLSSSNPLPAPASTREEGRE